MKPFLFIDMMCIVQEISDIGVLTERQSVDTRIVIEFKIYVLWLMSPNLFFEPIL